MASKGQMTGMLGVYLTAVELITNFVSALRHGRPVMPAIHLSTIRVDLGRSVGVR